MPAGKVPLCCFYTVFLVIKDMICSVRYYTILSVGGDKELIKIKKKPHRKKTLLRISKLSSKFIYVVYFSLNEEKTHISTVSHIGMVLVSE